MEAALRSAAWPTTVLALLLTLLPASEGGAQQLATAAQGAASEAPEALVPGDPTLETPPDRKSVV